MPALLSTHTQARAARRIAGYQLSVSAIRVIMRMALRCDSAQSLRVRIAKLSSQIVGSA
jgi:hypothetical protein